MIDSFKLLSLSWLSKEHTQSCSPKAPLKVESCWAVCRAQPSHGQVPDQTLATPHPVPAVMKTGTELLDPQFQWVSVTAQLCQRSATVAWGPHMMHPILNDSLKNDLEPTMYPRLASNSESSCLCLLDAGVLGIGATTSGFCLFVCFYILSDWGNPQKDTLWYVKIIWSLYFTVYK